jgi:energy-coupling factor transporter ATP-binding protein EcfA2
LIAESESDAKGKGFWRRLRKSKTAEPGTTSTAPSAEVKSAKSKSGEGKSAQARSGEPEKSADAEKSAEIVGAADDQGESPTTDGEDKPEAVAAAGSAEELAAAESAASEHATAGTASAEAPGANAGSNADADADADKAIADKVEAQGNDVEAEAAVNEPDSEEAVAAGSAGDEAAAAAAEASTAEAGESADSSAQEPAAEPVQEVRPTVGVVYEPDESLDGFPLDYGDIIIGLPRQPGDNKASEPTAGTVATDPTADSDQELAANPGESSESVEPEPEQSPDTDAQADPPADAAADPPADGDPTAKAGHPADPVPAVDPEPEPTADAQPAVDPEPEPTADAEPAVDSEPAEDAEPTADPEPAAEAESTADPEAEPAAGAETDAEAEPQVEASTEAEAEKSTEPTADDSAQPAADEGAEPAADEDAKREEEQLAEAGVAGGSPAGDGPDKLVAEETSEPEAEQPTEPVAEDFAPSAADEAGEPATSDAGEPSADDSDEPPADVVLSEAEAAAKAATEQAAMALITALMRLRGALASSQLPIDVVGADEARQQQKEMLDQLDDYVLPRLVQLEAPVLAVVGGSTGAGKSTLVNSLIGQVVSEPGVLRPTTRSPVLIHNPVDAEWFTGDRVLPGMARSSGDKPGGMEDPGQIRLVAADTVPQGLAVLDAPDIDSVVEANRELATQLLAAADLWLFVTTAARYADAVPWDFLQSASDRSTAVAVVLDRAPADTIDDITGHLAQMLLERGLGDSPLFSIRETVVDGNGMLPPETVASIKDWLIDLAADTEARTAVVRRTLQGAVTAMTKQTPAFATAVRAQADTIVELRSNAETAYERAVKDVATATQDGTMLRGEVLARWQEFVGTGELLKGLQTNVGRARDKVKDAVVGKPPPTRDLNDAVESGLVSLLREHAEAAAERAEGSWQSLAAGRQLLAAGDRDMGRMSEEFPAAAAKAVRDWQGYVLDLVRKEGADKRSTARILAYGVNGLGLSLMIVIFASTAGLTGAEVGVGAGTAVVGQKLLEAVFGDQAVRSLARKAREDLDGRVHALMDAEFARYLAVLDQHPVDPDAPRRLTEAARAVEDCT